MSIDIVHLSDIHLSSEGKNWIFEKQDKMIEAILSRSENKIIYVFVSGDIAQAGTHDDYKVAEKFFSSIEESLKAKGKDCKFILAPGNHDVDLGESEENDLRSSFLADSWSKNYAEAKPSFIKMLLGPQAEFINFSNQFALPISPNKMINHYVDDFINAIVINSAMVSTIPESKGRLLIPFTDLAEHRKVNGKLNIVMLHHPNGWFHQAISNQLKISIGHIADIVITGHEHSSDSYQKRDLNSMLNELYFEGGVLQSRNKNSASEFSMYSIDLKTDALKATLFKWKEKENYYATEDFESSLERKRSPLGLTLSKEINAHLNDPGPGIIHGKHRDLLLGDFFVFPKLKHFKNKAKTSVAGSINEESDFIKSLKDASNFIISGDDSSGKTTLSKKLFLSSLEGGYAPLILDGKELSSLNKTHVLNKINEKIKYTYQGFDSDKYFQIESSLRVLIFENADMTRGDSELHYRLFELMRQHFDKVILIVSSEYISEIDMISELKEHLEGIDYERYKIEPFGPSRRSKLIHNWLMLGHDNLDKDKLFKLNQLERQLDKHIVEYQIPRYPFFIICLLQQVETEKDFSLRCASNAKLFELMVNFALSNTENQNYTLQIKSNYLGALAFYLFTNNRDRLSREDLENFHSDYCEKNDLHYNLDSLLKELIESKVVACEGLKFAFKYEYFKFYYVAVYLHKNITRPETNELIKQITDDIHIYENANILTFLTLFVNDDKIIQQTVVKLSECLSDCNEGSFKEISQAVQAIADIDLSDAHDHEEERKNREKDEDGGTEKFGSRDYDPKNCIYQLGYCLRVMKITGQILRNSFDTISPDLKVRLVEETYKLGLRMLSFFQNALEGSEKELISYFAEYIKRNNPGLPQYKAYESARKQLVLIAYYSAVGVILRVSNAIGSEHLKLTYDKAFLSNPGLQIENIEKLKLDSKYFRLNIELENFTDFPDGKLEELKELASKDGFLTQILRNLVESALVTIRKDDKLVVNEACKLIDIDKDRIHKRILKN